MNAINNVPSIENRVGEPSPSNYALAVTEINPSWNFSRRHLITKTRSVDENRLFILSKGSPHLKHNWTLMWNLDYTPGTDLGKRKQETLYPIITEPLQGNEGLGSLVCTPYHQEQPVLTWRLAYHFIKGGAVTKQKVEGPLSCLWKGLDSPSGLAWSLAHSLPSDKIGTRP